MLSVLAPLMLLASVSTTHAAYTVRPHAPKVSRAAVAMLEDAGASSWTADVEQADKLTAVYFYAPWCRACKAALPRLQRVERKYADRVAFKRVDFKAESELCYRLRVFAFPTVLFYLPGIGRVASGELTASTTEEIMTSSLDRLLQGRELYERISAAGASAAITPVVQYSELVGALQGLAEMTDSTREMEARLTERRKEAEKRIRRVATEAGLSVAVTRDPTFKPSLTSLVSPKESTRLGLLLGSREEAARLRALVQGDDEYVARLQRPFTSLDSDANGELLLGRPQGGLAAAVSSLTPAGDGPASELLTRLSSSLAISADVDAPAAVSSAAPVDQTTFIELMVNKTVRDFANGQDALLPAFQALDADGDGHACGARPCDGSSSALLAAGCWLLAAGCWLLAAGCWLLAAGCWLLAAAAGCWPLAAAHQRLLGCGAFAGSC
jgi:thiol-disulfide isomerase/thioredoxin